MPRGRTPLAAWALNTHTGCTRERHARSGVGAPVRLRAGGDAPAGRSSNASDGRVPRSAQPRPRRWPAAALGTWQWTLRAPVPTGTGRCRVGGRRLSGNRIHHGRRQQEGNRATFVSCVTYAGVKGSARCPRPSRSRSGRFPLWADAVRTVLGRRRRSAHDSGRFLGSSPGPYLRGVFSTEIGRGVGRPPRSHSAPRDALGRRTP